VTTAPTRSTVEELHSPLATAPPTAACLSLAPTGTPFTTPPQPTRPGDVPERPADAPPDSFRLAQPRGGAPPSGASPRNPLPRGVLGSRHLVSAGPRADRASAPTGSVRPPRARPRSSLRIDRFSPSYRARPPSRAALPLRSGVTCARAAQCSRQHSAELHAENVQHAGAREAALSRSTVAPNGRSTAPTGFSAIPSALTGIFSFKGDDATRERRSQ